MASEARHVRTPDEHERLMAEIRDENVLSIALSEMPVEMPEFAGRKIGSGANRAVYDHTENPAWVVKVAHSVHICSANIGEWYSYVLLHRLGLQHWIAPCIETAWDGSWLIMARTEPITEPVELEIPVILSWDTKLGNWGWLNGRIVCHDYSTIELGGLRAAFQFTQKVEISG